MIYLDHAATTPVPKAVADAMYTVLTEQYANPNAQYPFGQEMRRSVEDWRAVIAKAVGCEANQLFFTSCGTEGDNWAIRAACWQNRHVGRHIVTTAVEHHAVLNCCQQLEQEGWEVTTILPDQNGDISAESVLAAVRPDTALVSVMMVNNELGNIYPIADIAKGLKVVNEKTLLHTDAVQGFLKVPFSAKALGADFIAISVGDGCTIAGVWKGLKDLYAIGFIDKLPRLISAQAEGCHPINRAIAENKPWEPMEENTLADSIAVGVPRNADKALMAIRESNGIVVNVTDEEIMAAQKLLGTTCGVFGEPAGVTGTAGVKKLCEQGVIGKKDTVVSVVTGNGLKDVANAIKFCGEPMKLPNDLSLLTAEFDRRGIRTE